MCASHPYRNTALTLASVSGVLAIEAQGSGDQGELGAGEVAGGAQRRLVAEQRLRRVGEEVAVAVVGERRDLPPGRVAAAGQRRRRA